MVGVGAALHICQVLADKSHGFYHVGGNVLELEQLVLFHTTPPPLTVQMLRDQPAELIEMGFPQVRATFVFSVSFRSAVLATIHTLLPGAVSANRSAGIVSNFPRI